MKIVLLLILCFTAVVSADETVKPRYFVEVGSALQKGQGAFDGKLVLTAQSDDTTKADEQMQVPYLGAFMAYSGRIGAQIKASSIALSVEFASPTALDTSSSWLGVIVDYRYHFMYPDSWRPFLGLNYGFTRWVVGTGKNEVLYNSNGPGIETGLGYYWQGVSISFRLRERYLPVKNLSTQEQSYSKLSKPLHVFVGDVYLGVQYTF